MGNYTVYMHVCPNGKRYVGITSTNILKRWRKNGEGYKTQQFFKRAIKKYGWGNIEHEVLFENLSQKEAELKESELIDFYKTNNSEYGYNIASGGELRNGLVGNKNGMYGKTHTLEAREKIRKSKIGFKHSEETRQKMSERMKGNKITLGYKPTDKTIKKLQQAHRGCNNGFYGKIHSDKTKKTMSEKAKNRNLILKNNPNAKKITILHNENVYEFLTRKECAIFLNISYSQLWWRIKNGKIIDIGGDAIANT